MAVLFNIIKARLRRIQIITSRLGHYLTRGLLDLYLRSLVERQGSQVGDRWL
jgi:hypothetical protein